MSLSCFGYGISLENKRSLDMAIPKHATRVHFAGWTSVVIETAGGDVEICGEYAPEEADLIQTLKDSRCALDDIHLYGWESLQGMMSSTGDVIGLCRRNSSSTLINEQEEEKGREERGEMSAPWVLFRNAKSVAACGQSTNHWTVAIDRSTGELYEWTALNPIPQPVLKDASFNSASSMLKSVKFERVWAGEAHMLAVTQGDGTLYSWGSGRYGQLGQGDLGSGTIPKPVEALEGIRIVDVGCGASFSVALSDIGDVYTFGLNDHGQLGIGNQIASYSKDMRDKPPRNTASPQLVDFYEDNQEESIDVNVIRVACGRAHAVVLDDRGQAWSCGWGKYGQLGPTTTTINRSQMDAMLRSLGCAVVAADQARFRKMAVSPSEAAWRNISCGLWSTFLMS